MEYGVLFKGLRASILVPMIVTSGEVMIAAGSIQTAYNSMFILACQMLRAALPTLA